jgi:hypothetical protein
MLKAIASGKMCDRNSHEFTCYSANGDDIIVTAWVSRVELGAEKILLLELRNDSEISFHRQQGIIQEEVLNGIRSSSFPTRLLSYSAPSEFYPRYAMVGVFLDFSITTSALVRPDSDMNQRLEVLDGYLGGHKGAVVVQHSFGSWIAIFVDQSQNADYMDFALEYFDCARLPGCQVSGFLVLDEEITLVSVSTQDPESSSTKEVPSYGIEPVCAMMSMLPELIKALGPGIVIIDPAFPSPFEGEMQLQSKVRLNGKTLHKLKITEDVFRQD